MSEASCISSCCTGRGADLGVPKTIFHLGNYLLHSLPDAAVSVSSLGKADGKPYMNGTPTAAAGSNRVEMTYLTRDSERHLGPGSANRSLSEARPAGRQGT